MTQRIALVTGGMGGLGEAICMKLARMGIKGHRDLFAEQHQGGRVAEGHGQSRLSLPCLPGGRGGIFDSVPNPWRKIQKEVGPIDILINNAGITRDTTFKPNKVGWDAVMKTNPTACSTCANPSLMAWSSAAGAG